MKKFSIFMAIAILFLSTFKYHLGKIPLVNMYANHYVFQYFDKKYYQDKLNLRKTSDPLVAKVLILFGEDVNPEPSQRGRRDSSPLGAHIKAYNDCPLFRTNRDIEEISECEENNLEIIRILLDNGADFKNAQFQTRHVPILKLLLEFGANMEEKNYEGATALFYQTKNMYKHSNYHRKDLDKSAFEFLISQGANIHTKNKKKQTLMHVSKHSEIIESLVDKGLDINAKDKFGNTPIFYRAKDLTKPKPLKILVENRAVIDIKNHKNQTPLEYILQSKRYPNKINKNALYLLKKGAHVNDEIYVNALHIKKPKKLPDESWTEKMLIEYADINKNDEFGIPAVTHKMGLYKFSLDFDIWKSMEYLVNFDFATKVITSYDKNISKAQNSLGNTPLHYVVRYSVELTDYFIGQGVDVNSLNNKGQTALFFADNVAIAEKLIDKGADIYIKDHKGKNALDYIQNPKLLNYLIVRL